MTTQELEQVIQEYFLNIYHKKYIGKLHIEKLDPVGYYIKFGMDRPFQPLIIYAQLEDKEFLKFLKQELKEKRFNMVNYGQLNLTYPYDCGPRNTSCNCHDKGRINVED